MRLLKPLVLALFGLLASVGLAQIPAPQINLSGNIGCQGFPCVNNGTLIMGVDANHSMTAQETSAFAIKVTSSVSLTATRNLIFPSGNFLVDVENATTGGQSIQVIGASGTGVTIANGQTVRVWNDGTNFVQVGSAASAGVASINSTTGTFTFTGSGVGCTGTTCTFSAGSGSLPTAASPGQIISSTAAGATYAVQGQIFYNQAGDTISSIEAECSSLCTYVVTVPQTITLSGNHTLNSNVTLKFEAGGLWTVNGAFTLTLSKVLGTPTQHFAGTSTIGGITGAVSPEWFGAVPYTTWAGVIAGTIANTSLQAAASALAPGAWLQFPCAAFRVTTQIGMADVSGTGIKGPCPGVLTSASTSPISAVVNTTANTSTWIICGCSVVTTFNYIEGVSFERSVAPTGSVDGILLGGLSNFSGKNWGSYDSINNVHLHNFQGGDVINLQNVQAGWGFSTSGYTGQAATGFFVDTLDGTISAPVNLVNLTSAVSPGTNVVATGYFDSGSQPRGHKLYGFQGDNLTNCVQVNATGSGTSGDQNAANNITNLWCDGTTGRGIEVDNLIGAAASPSLNISGGWIDAAGDNSVYLNGDVGVNVTGLSVRNTGTGRGIYLSACVGCTVSDNIVFRTVGDNLNVTNGGNNIISGNNFRGDSGFAFGNAMHFVTTGYNTITGNQCGGFGTTCLNLAAGTQIEDIAGNGCNPTNITNCNAVALYLPSFGEEPVLASFGNFSGNVTSLLNEIEIAPTLASASTIAPLGGVAHVTGTVAIATMTPPANCTIVGWGCEVTLIADGAWTIGTGGNFNAALSATSGAKYTFVYDPNVSKWFAGPVGPGFANPMTTLGDIITGGASGVPGRVGIGTTGQVLEVVGGVPAWATVTGTGTVTHTIGALTASGCVIGNGGGDIKVDPNCSLDGSGNMTAASYTAVGTTPASISLAAGTGSIPALAANSFGFAAPVTGGTSYLIKAPATITAGIAHFAAPATADGVNESALTSSAVNLASADVTGLLPHANIAATAVTPGSYTAANITVAADGTITAAANGSGGGGNTTSTSLSTSTIPKANGANSIVNSLLTDNGTAATYTGTGGFNSIINSSILNFCADTSGSGTAQACTTPTTFVPGGGSCIVYTTTTPNSGAGLTINVNSLGAKSVSKWMGSTTTLAANDVLANKDVWACYDGTTWELSTIGNAPSGAGTPAYPLTITGGVSGGVVYGSSPTQLTVSPAGTANVLMKWGGAATAPGNSTVTDTGTTVTSTATGGYVAPVFTANGTTAGFVDYPQGTTSVAVAPCNTATSICEQAPTSVTSYLVVKPGAAGQGVQTNTLTSAVITQGYSGDASHSATVTTGSGTSIGSTSLCSSAICPVGTYRVNVYTDITTACGTTGTYIVNLIYTDDQGSKTIPVNINGTGAVPATGILTTTSTANFGENAQIIRSTGAASINYSTTATACGTAGPMVGKLYLSVEPVQ